jgi:hypothetical protein
MLTTVGKELMKIIDPADDLEAVRAFADAIPKGKGIAKIGYGKILRDGAGIKMVATVWEKPQAVEPEPHG